MTFRLAIAAFLLRLCLLREIPVISYSAGKAAMGDWTSDAPGVRRKITVDDLPPPNETKSVSNDATVVKQPKDAQLKVPSGFKIEEYAQLPQSALPPHRTERRHLRHGK